MTYITVNKDNTHYKDISGVLFDYSGATLIQYPLGNTTRTSYEIPESVTTIEANALYNASGLISLTIPASVTNIGNAAFVGMSKLTNITVNSSNTGYKDISGVLFDYSGATLIQYPIGNTITSYEIPESVTTIGQNAFTIATNLTIVTFAPNSQLTSIGENAFSNVSNVTSISIPVGVTTIGSYAFQNMFSLTSINIPASVTTIGQEVFRNASSLTTVYIPAINGLNISSPATGVSFFGVTVTTSISE
jgi:hypothetical protein